MITKFRLHDRVRRIIGKIEGEVIAIDSKVTVKFPHGTFRFSERELVKIGS